MKEYQRRKKEDEEILEIACKAREEEIMQANKLTEAEKYRIKERVSLFLGLLYEKFTVRHSLHIRFSNRSESLDISGMLLSAY